MTFNAGLQFSVYLAALLCLVKPLGAYMARVYERKRCGLDRLFGPCERWFYRLAGVDPEAINRVEFALNMLKRSATGKLAIEKVMADLDDKFGLTAKGLAALRWTIVPDAADAAPAKPKRQRSDDEPLLRAV